MDKGFSGKMPNVLLRLSSIGSEWLSRPTVAYHLLCNRDRDFGSTSTIHTQSEPIPSFHLDN